MNRCVRKITDIYILGTLVLDNVEFGSYFLQYASNIRLVFP